MKEKLSQDWTYGPVIDLDAKISPLLVTYNELPKEKRLKDYLMTAVVEQCYHVFKEVTGYD